MKINENEVHVWLCEDGSIVNSALLKQYYCLLNLDEQESLKRFNSKENKHQYLLTRVLIRTTLSKYYPEIPPNDWVFEKNKYGKPHISSIMDLLGFDHFESKCILPGAEATKMRAPVNFNISHTDGLIVLAVCAEGDIGVDVENKERGGALLDIASRNFSSSEINSLFILPVAEQRNRFFDLWTLKEAYMKACGIGLSILMDEFSYMFDARGGVRIKFDAVLDDDPCNWQFWSYDMSGQYRVSLAVKSFSGSAKKNKVICRRIVPMVWEEYFESTLKISSEIK